MNRKLGDITVGEAIRFATLCMVAWMLMDGIKAAFGLVPALIISGVLGFGVIAWIDALDRKRRS